jgi:hypothetical protein
MTDHPYRNSPPKALWRSAVAGRSYFDLEDICAPLPLSLADRFATAGSCFAQHIGRNLAARGAAWLDREPAPDFLPPEDRARFGYGLFSARYGNIYTARQLLQLAREALGERIPRERVWRKDERHYDAQRPSVDPVGLASHDEVLALREQHLAVFAGLLAELDVFVFTLGLTEAWQSREDGTVFPMAPGVLCGAYDPAVHAFANFDALAVHEDLAAFHALLKSVNPEARLLLTVSPVPLIATASPEHVLVATTYSKSVLRAAAGSLAARLPDCHYFPSYELIASHPSRGMFFNPDLRTVNDRGVGFVMEHFFRALGGGGGEEAVTGDLACDEENIEAAIPT